MTNQMQENMKRAQKRDAVHNEKFYFRKSVVPDDEDETDEGAEPRGSHDQSHDHEYSEMSVDTILNGKVHAQVHLNCRLYSILSLEWNQDEFPGLIPLVRMYVNSIDIDIDTRCTVMQYLRLISKRASGIILYLKLRVTNLAMWVNQLTSLWFLSIK